MLKIQTSGIRYVAILLTAFFASGLIMQAVNADARPGRHNRHAVKRHHHPRGHVIKVLPRRHRIVRFGGMRYFFFGGLFYRPARAGYMVVAPPIGAIVTVLPVGFNTIVIGGAPHFFFNGIYYRKHAGGFIVVEAPPGADPE
ncbi:hypothetical protein MNBD_NITROSPINAE02-1542 [hydrothermal vent metagenome]|uniref:Uncharacterized protein n=1 Tax=hydrothermal vent metagenome TaxID=652676 RepID=A0A3B1C047_9ZZZZ